MTTGLLLMAVVAAACVPPPTGPSTEPSGPAPVISEFSVVGPTVAGQPITVQARITHPVGVTQSDWKMKSPGGSLDGPERFCSDLDETTSGPATDLFVTLTCTLPTSAPSGYWLFFVEAEGVGSRSTSEDVQFELVGGYQVAHLLSQSVEPSTVPSGSKFTLTATFTSEFWIWTIWHPRFPTDPPTGPPCVIATQPHTPTGDGTYQFECDSTGMAPGTYQLTARWFPLGDYEEVAATWEIQVI